MGPWTPESEPVTTAGGAVTIVEGSSFCISAPSGDLGVPGPHGVFFRDTRILSRWDLSIDGEPPEPLAAMTPDPYRATFLARVPRRAARSDTNLLVQRERRVGNGLREELVLRNPAGEPAACTVIVRVDADFADLFEVKEGRVRPRAERTLQAQGERLLLDQRWRGNHRGAVVEAPGATVLEGGTISYTVVVPARGQWSTSLLVRPVVNGEDVDPAFPLDRPLADSVPARRLERWQQSTPMATTGNDALQRTLDRTQKDLGALRIFDPDDPSLAVIAAGAPWFMALFGRDSLLSSYMALPLDPTLALGTMQTLARMQGTKVDPRTEEQPGRILHETRLGADFPLSHGGGSIYYGTVDATPLFVMLLGELRRWSIASEQVDALLPHADRALAWIERYGDRDGDGFVEYQRSTEVGLVNQGWKDSWDGVNFADGRLAETPIALCEVQAYVYAAYVARSHFADLAGDDAATQHWADKADAIKAAFNEQFWVPDRGWFAVALDGQKRQVDALTSNIGHCLWTGIVDDDKAARVAEQLMSPEMFTGWGVRTLASSMGRFNPMSYHNGSVWPHDSVLVATGLMRYGFVDEAQRIGTGLLDAATHFGGRLPELFCGFDRSEYPSPVPYPTSCSPQAWAAATPIQVMRMLLRLEPRMPRDKVWFAPAWPARYGPVRVHDLPLGGRRVTLVIDGDRAELEGLPDGVEVIREPRPPVEPARPGQG
jgi:glycogen debranching enzyme